MLISDLLKGLGFHNDHSHSKCGHYDHACTFQIWNLSVLKKNPIQHTTYHIACPKMNCTGGEGSLSSNFTWPQTGNTGQLVLSISTMSFCCYPVLPNCSTAIQCTFIAPVVSSGGPPWPTSRACVNFQWVFALCELPIYFMLFIGWQGKETGGQCWCKTGSNYYN